MDAPKVLNTIQLDLLVHREEYKLSIEAATIIVLCYIGFVDFRTFKIQNLSIILLLILYLYCMQFSSAREMQSALNILLALIMFGVSLGFLREKTYRWRRRETAIRDLPMGGNTLCVALFRRSPRVRRPPVCRNENGLGSYQ